MRLSDSNISKEFRVGDVCFEYKYRKDELMNLPIGEYDVVIDLNNDKILVTNRRLVDGWKVIASILIHKDTKTERCNAAREAKNAVSKLKMVTKGTVAKTYGKDVADKAPVCKYADNPYYKCSHKMQLYLVESLKYLFGEKDIVR